MRRPPNNGPWTRWDLFSMRDYGEWMLIVAVTWTLVVAVLWTAQHRDDPLRLPLFLCVLPGLLLLSLVGWVRKPACPSQFPRGDLVEPLPPRTRVVERSTSDLRGTASQSTVISSATEGVDTLRARTLAHYVSNGWRDGHTESGSYLVAGDWSLLITGWAANQNEPRASPLGVELQLMQSDPGCDALS
jgi:hypothetical protein